MIFMTMRNMLSKTKQQKKKKTKSELVPKMRQICILVYFLVEMIRNWSKLFYY